jgi:membrane fusion protein (multidrug efflux system)
MPVIRDIVDMQKYKIAVAMVAGLALVAGGYAWWRHVQRFQRTSDAYVGAHVVRIAAQVGGEVKELPVKDHDHVEQGQLLLGLDAEPYKIALDRAAANVALAEQARAAADATVSATRARVKEREAARDDAQHNNARMQDLSKQQDVARAKADSAKYALSEAAAALDAARAELDQAVRAQDEAVAKVRVAKAALAEARLDLSHARVTAPAAGVLGEIRIRPGDVISPGQQLFPLVEDSPVWVNANYKETALQRIHTGQSATISVDMYPGKTYSGEVESLSPASGVAFSLLPPENATGNWVKVTQRFPVRVRIINPDADTPLRVGASSTVTIDTEGYPLKNVSQTEYQPAVELSDANKP